MKPSDLRRDAYTWQAIARSAKVRGDAAADDDFMSLSAQWYATARAVRKLVERMNLAADELEARNAS